jgi:hypothetical protein
MYLETFKSEYLKHLDILSKDERFAVEFFYGLSGKPKLNIPGIAELRRTPGISDAEVRILISKALNKLQDAAKNT